MLAVFFLNRARCIYREIGDQRDSRSTVHGDFLRSNEATVIFRSSLCLHMLEATGAVSAIIVITHGCAPVVADEVILLIVAAAEEFEGTGVRVVAYSLENHVVTLLDGTVSDILHSLDERKGAAVSSLCFFLKMHGKSMLVIKVPSTPESHRAAPEDEELSRSAPDVWHLVEKLGAAILIEVSVAEHWRM